MPQGEAPRMVWNADSGQGWVLPDEEGRPPGKGTTAHRLAVVPPLPDTMPERGAGEVCSTVRQDFLAVILI